MRVGQRFRSRRGSKELRYGKVGDKKSWDSSDKWEQERETYIALSNGG